MNSPDPKNAEDFNDLFVDRNLLDVFKEEPTIFANRFNGSATSIVFLILLAFSIIRFHHRTEMPSPSFVATFAIWANVGWTLAGTLLGFLIAGFALLCTVLRPSAVIALHNYQQKDDKRNLLRQLFISFVGLFITYISLLMFSVAMVMVTSPNGPSIEIKFLLLRISSQTPAIVGYIVLVAWGTWFAIAALKLKSFIYNLYQSLMVGMAESAHSALECVNMVNDQKSNSHVALSGMKASDTLSS